MNDDLTPAQKEAQNRVHDLLAELAEVIGPDFDGEHGLDEPPYGSTFLSEWILVLAWVDEAGSGFTTRIGSPNLLHHHQVGLLHEGLYGFGD